MSAGLTTDCLHLVGALGTNKVMAGELSRLAKRAFSEERSRQLLTHPPRKAGPGGLLYPFAPDLATLAVFYHRTSARVLWTLYESEATRLDPLYEELLRKIAEDEREYIKDEGTFSVLAFGAGPVEAGERQVVGVVKNALMEGSARRGVRLKLDPQNPTYTFHVRALEDLSGKKTLSVSLDLAGRPMHQRGYRTHSGPAPLREDLAANLVMLTRFNPKSDVLIDPLAGSGTLAIEASLMAAGKPVWMSGREPSARSVPALMDATRGRKTPLFADSAPKMFAAEIDEETYGALDRAIETSGTSGQITTFLGDFRDWDLRAQLGEQKTGVILSNPPFGARLEGSVHELRALYRDLSDWCAQFRGFRAGFIVGEPEPDRTLREGPSIVGLFQDAFGGRPRVKKPLRNGPLHAQFLLYDL